MKTNRYRKDSSRGFTLIELLVVIAIIGVLSAVVLASLNTARYRANDAKRQADLHSLQTAIELYYSRHNAYPSTGGSWFGIAPPSSATPNWIPGLVAEGDIPSLPQDPTYPQHVGGLCASWPSMYLYRSIDGSGYELLDFCPVNSSVTSTKTSDNLYDPQRPTWAWKVCSGIECGQ